MKFRLYLKSFDNNKLISSSHQIRKNLQQGNWKINHFIALPNRIRKFCVIRSPHIDKDSREQFEVTIYKRFLDIESNSAEILDSLLQIEIPSGIYCSLKFLDS